MYTGHDGSEEFDGCYRLHPQRFMRALLQQRLLQPKALKIPQDEAGEDMPAGIKAKVFIAANSAAGEVGGRMAECDPVRAWPLRELLNWKRNIKSIACSCIHVLQTSLDGFRQIADACVCVEAPCVWTRNVMAASTVLQQTWRWPTITWLRFDEVVENYEARMMPSPIPFAAPVSGLSSSPNGS